MNTIPIDLLATSPLLQRVRMPHTETVRMSPFRLRAIQAEVRRLLTEEPEGIREKVISLLAAIVEYYQRNGEKMPVFALQDDQEHITYDGLAQKMLNVYAVLLPGADAVLWTSQRIHRGLLDKDLIKQLLDAVAAINELVVDAEVGKHFCAVHDLVAELEVGR